MVSLLTKSLVKDSLNHIVPRKYIAVFVFAENCEALLHCKSSSHFSKKMAIFLRLIRLKI